MGESQSGQELQHGSKEEVQCDSMEWKKMSSTLQEGRVFGGEVG